MDDEVSRFWYELEQEDTACMSESLASTIPGYLRNLLWILGYSTRSALTRMTPEDVAEVEQMARTSVPSLIGDADPELFLGLFKGNPEQFRIMPGHRKLLLGLVERLKKRPGDRRLKAARPPVYEQEHILPSVVLDEAHTPASSPLPPPESAVPLDLATLERNLMTWLTTNQHTLLQPPLTISELSITPSVLTNEIASSGNVAGVASVRCLRCSVRLQVYYVNKGKSNSWVTSNFHRHMKRKHCIPGMFTPKKRSKGELKGVSSTNGRIEHVEFPAGQSLKLEYESSDPLVEDDN